MRTIGAPAWFTRGPIRSLPIELRNIVTCLALASLFASLTPLPVPGFEVSAEAARYRLAGRTLTCGVGKIVVNNRMRSLGRASPSKQELYINKRALRRYPAAFQHFVFLHECAHMRVRDETQADCWALKRGKYRGLFTRRSVDQICKALWSTPAGRFHFAGPDRCQHLKSCWQSAR